MERIDTCQKEACLIDFRILFRNCMGLLAKEMLPTFARGSVLPDSDDMVVVFGENMDAMSTCVCFVPDATLKVTSQLAMQPELEFRTIGFLHAGPLF